MKHFSIALLALTITLFSLPSFSQIVKEGDITISAGYGFPNLVGAVFKTYESNNDFKVTSIGPVYLKGEYMIEEKIGIGGVAAYAGNSISYNYLGILDSGATTTYEDKISRTTLSILARFNYYFVNSEKANIYAGVGTGYRIANWKYTFGDPDIDDSNNEIPNLVPLGFEFTFGARYFFTENIGIYTELGLAKSLFQVGLSAKF